MRSNIESRALSLGVVKRWLLVTLVLLASWSAQAGPNACRDLFGLVTPGVPYAFRNRVLETGTNAVAASDFHQGSMALSFFRLGEMGRLLNQSDPALAKHGLLIPKGGLCNPTCLVNIITAGLEQSGQYLNRPREDIMRDLVQLYDRKTKTDGRIGTATNPLLDVTATLFGESFSSEEISILWKSADQPIQAALRNDHSLVLGTVAFQQKLEVHTHHAIVILKVDPASQMVVIGDPNTPDIVYNTKYRLDSAGQMHFDILPIYGARSHEVTLVRAYSISWKDAPPERRSAEPAIQISHTRTPIDRQWVHDEIDRAWNGDLLEMKIIEYDKQNDVLTVYAKVGDHRMPDYEIYKFSLLNKKVIQKFRTLKGYYESGLDTDIFKP